MASFLYQSFWADVLNNTIDLGVDTFNVMLVSSGYVPDKTGHSKLSDVTSEITGTGYVAGGQVGDISFVRDDPNSQIDITIAQAQWAGITIDGAGAAGAVIYKARGGAAIADELVAFIDFGGDVDAAGGQFTAQASTITLDNASV